MESWATDLANGVKDALKSGDSCCICVHSETQKELGEIAAKRMASNPGQAARVSFEINPRYPVGAILVP